MGCKNRLPPEEGLSPAEVAQMLPLFKETAIKERGAHKFEKRDLFSFDQLSTEERGVFSRQPLSNYFQLLEKTWLRKQFGEGCGERSPTLGL